MRGMSDPPHKKAIAFGSLMLIPGKRYQVVLPFVDFDGDLHESHQQWVFLGHNFVPYEDGLTLSVVWDDGSQGIMRFRWDMHHQGHILDAFERYVSLADPGREAEG